MSPEARAAAVEAVSAEVEQAREYAAVAQTNWETAVDVSGRAAQTLTTAEQARDQAAGRLDALLEALQSLQDAPTGTSAQ